MNLSFSARSDITDRSRPIGLLGLHGGLLDDRAVPQFGGVRHICFPGEVGDLRRGDAVHPHRRIAGLVQPLQVREQALEA
ncbi:hypothetical protein [Streptomyces sp. enrichment culture]|uniref:hypothetical protein n=1 Tax=Streptomyces sp. enrichment culture TaxID=1795815 RepID=UPI003F54C742